MLETTLTASVFLWFYFDRKDAQKSQEITKREKQCEISRYCLKVLDSCKTHEQLFSVTKLVKNCTNKGYVDRNDYHMLIKRIWSMHNAL